MNQKIEAYLKKHEKWSQQLHTLRDILLNTDLEETVKWGVPTYCINGQNVVGLAAFKNHTGLWFFQGALLQDAKKILRNAQEGKTKAMRSIQIVEGESIDVSLIKTYVNEAILNAKAGKKVDMPKRKQVQAKDVNIPELLADQMKGNTKLSNAFASLTTAQQRDYCDYIHNAKRQATKESRLAKILPLIEQGKPLAQLWC